MIRIEYRTGVKAENGTGVENENGTVVENECVDGIAIDSGIRNEIGIYRYKKKEGIHSTSMVTKLLELFIRASHPQERAEQYMPGRLRRPRPALAISPFAAFTRANPTRGRVVCEICTSPNRSITELTEYVTEQNAQRIDPTRPVIAKRASHERLASLMAGHERRGWLRNRD
ncbi:hypothetical protein EVAR_96846_1 [Eumeta japonica]|uniref:Uncharacterized protein n=1 Tax=Eumeta variegata TaxID=151549 RepID=A0A4C1TPD1_EUMVA|nr:hypothetical protein EVAR_96846_1 [Eumeta japonica]